MLTFCQNCANNSVAYGSRTRTNGSGCDIRDEQGRKKELHFETMNEHKVQKESFGGKSAKL